MTESEALSVLRDLVAGADDYRCWYIPSEIEARARAVVAVASPTAPPTEPRCTYNTCGGDDVAGYMEVKAERDAARAEVAELTEGNRLLYRHAKQLRAALQTMIVDSFNYSCGMTSDVEHIEDLEAARAVLADTAGSE